MARLAVFISHPIQHFSPLFRSLTQLMDLQVFYYSTFGQDYNHVDPGFGVAIKWDVPLLDGYRYKFLPTVPWLSEAYLGRCRLNLEVLRVLKQGSWDAVLLFGYSSINDWVVWLAASLLKIPVMLITDSELLHKRTRFAKLAKEIPIRMFFARISGLLAIGDNNRAYGRRYGVKPKNIFPCVLPVDVDRFASLLTVPDLKHKLETLRRKHCIPTGARVVLFCGKLAAHKRPLDLVEAVAQMTIDDSSVVTVFVGSGSLEQDIRMAGKNQVRVIGFVNQSELPLYYAMSEILVMPSERDAHPLTVTEAASMGIPAIVSDRVGCVGPNDVLRNGENGLVYPCGDVAQLRRAIALLLTDEELYTVMSMRARELAAMQSPRMAATHIQAALEQVMKCKE